MLNILLMEKRKLGEGRYNELGESGTPSVGRKFQQLDVREVNGGLEKKGHFDLRRHWSSRASRPK